MRVFRWSRDEQPAASFTPCMSRCWCHRPDPQWGTIGAVSKRPDAACRHGAGGHRWRLEAEQDSFQGVLFTMRYCLCLRPRARFADNMIRKKKVKLAVDSENWCCVELRHQPLSRHCPIYPWLSHSVIQDSIELHNYILLALSLRYHTWLIRAESKANRLWQTRASGLGFENRSVYSKHRTFWVGL